MLLPLQDEKNNGERKKKINLPLWSLKKEDKKGFHPIAWCIISDTGSLALASADYNYPCSITAGECYCEALGWWMLWEVKQSLLIIGSLRCYMDLCERIPFLPWKDHRAPRTPCCAPIPVLCSLQLPQLAGPLFSVVSEGSFPFHTEKGSLLCPWVISSPFPGQQGGGKEGKLCLQQLTEWLVQKRKAGVHRVVTP